MELVKAGTNPLQYLEECHTVMDFVNSGMCSTDLRAARADINKAIKRADKDRTHFKKLFLAEFETRFAEVYGVEEMKSLHAEVDDWFKEAKKKEDKAELERIEALIIETNNEQVDRNQLPTAARFRGKGESYIISHIQEVIDDIIFSEEEVEVAPEPQEVNEFIVTMSMTTTDKMLAREIQGLCRKAGVKVAIQKG